MNPSGYRLDRKGRFPAQPRRDRQFVRIILAPHHQVALAPAQTLQLLADNPLGFDFGGFTPQFSGMVFSHWRRFPRLITWYDAPRKLYA